MSAARAAMDGGAALRTLGALVAVAAVLAASCGGDGGRSTTLTALPDAPIHEQSSSRSDPALTG